MRPINIVNSDNRMLASAIRLKIEPVLAAWIDPDQRGFLPGRSLLSNVIDIEERMLHTAATQEEGATLQGCLPVHLPRLRTSSRLLRTRESPTTS